MTENEAVAWCAARWPSDRVEKLAAFAEMVIAENGRQNLIAPATCPTIWSRHVVDSAQLIALAPCAITSWLDVGSGAGFPGAVIAILIDAPVTMVEPRIRRVEFLRSAAATLALGNMSVLHAKAEAVTGQFDVISARAVAALPTLLTITGHLRHATTRLILPRGRNGVSEVQQLSRDLRRMFHVEHSITDAESVIAVADGVN